MKRLATKATQFFFQYCQTVQNQPKSKLLFHKNCSPRNLYIMTLGPGYQTAGCSINSFQITMEAPPGIPGLSKNPDFFFLKMKLIAVCDKTWPKLKKLGKNLQN